MMPAFLRSSGWAYLIAVVAASAVLLVDALVKGSLQIFLGTVAFIFAVLAAAAVGGWRPGLLTTVLCVGGYIFLFVNPPYSFWVPNFMDAVPLLGYLVVGAAVSFLCEGLHRARARSADRQRRLEQEIIEHERAELALKDGERRKDEFLATLAHELRNPLAPISNAVQLLQMRQADDPELGYITDIMERQVQTMVRLVDDLLDVSRITRGKLNLTLERIELSGAIRSALEAADPLIQEAGHELTVSLPPESIYVNADATRVAQLFTNLLNNAAKYTPAGGRIWLTVRDDGDEAVVAIRDTGIGIEHDHLEHIFEPFSQVVPSLERPHGGLGIGLALARSLAELQGGRIEAHSAGAGHGSEFIVRLPKATSSAPLKNNGGNGGLVLGTATGRILLADDNPDEASSLAMMLRQTGYDVNTASDGAEALEAAERVQPDAILLDIGMPRMNGYEAARRIREQAWGSEVLLIATTGWGQEEDKRRAFEAGFDHHLTKPVELGALQELLQPAK